MKIQKEKTNTKLFHVSKDVSLIEKQFVPRAPRNRLPEENGVLKRVCLSTSIKNCLSSFPYKSELMWHIVSSLPTYLAVYSVLENELNEGKFKKPHEIFDLVPDAMKNDEHWALEPFFAEPYLIKVKKLEFSNYCRHTNHHGGDVVELTYEKEVEDLVREEMATFYHNKIYKQFVKACIQNGIVILDIEKSQECMYYSGLVASSRVYNIKRIKYKIPSGISARPIWSIIQKELNRNKRKYLCFSRADFI